MTRRQLRECLAQIGVVVRLGDDTNDEAGKHRVIVAQFEHRVEDGLELRGESVVLGNCSLERLEYLRLNVKKHCDEQIDL